MADYISQITLPDNETYNIKDAKASTRGIEYIRGTWAAASGAWTGVSQDEALYDGKQILLYMPFAGSGNATLNLTLANGTTTGPINVYYESTSRFTTHKGAYSQLHLIYHVNHNINGTNYTGWWYVANRDTNDTAYYIRRTYPNIKAGAGSVHPYSIIMQLSNGRWSSITSTAPNNPGASNVSPKATGKSANTNGFLLGHVLLMYANATYADGSNVGTYNIWSAHSGLIDARYSFNLENTEGKRFTGYASVYIVGTLDSGLFKLDTTQWWTQTLPSSDDGKLYIYIGDAYDWYRITFTEDHPIYWYKNGRIQLYAGTSEYALDASTVNGLTVQTAVPTNALFTDTNKYHKTGSWSGLTYIADAINEADELKFTIPTGTTATTVAVGNHNHDTVYAKIDDSILLQASVSSSTLTNNWMLTAKKGYYHIGGPNNAENTFLENISNKFGVLTVISDRTDSMTSAEEYGYILFSNASNEIYYRNFYRKRSTNTLTWRDNLQKILTDGNTTTGANNEATLTWNTTYTIAKINGTDIKFTTMAKPSYAFTDLTSHPTTLSGYGITDAMAGNTIVTNVAHTLGTTTEYYVTGSTTATTNTSGDTFDTGVYVTTTPGQLSATSYNINYDGNEKVTLKWNNADSSLDFIFV